VAATKPTDWSIVLTLFTKLQSIEHKKAMDSANTYSRDLIRKFSRRQRVISLALVILTLISLLLGWRDIANDEEANEIINLAGRQRMLSQRMALYLTLQQHEPDHEKQRQYGDAANAAAAVFDQAHARLAAAAGKLGADSPIHSLYFGPTGSVDADSRRYYSLVRAAVEASASARPVDAEGTARLLAAADSSLIKQLDQATLLYQRDGEQRLTTLLRLLQISTLLVVGLLAFGLLGVFRPVIRRLAIDVAARNQAEHDLKESEERFKAFSESSSDWFWETDVEHRFTWVQNGTNVQSPLPLEQVRGRTRYEMRTEIEKAAVEKWQAYQADLDARRPFRDLEYQFGLDSQGLRWVSVNGQPFFDGNGNFLGYRGTARYIQKRKDIEASHLRLQQAIEQSPVSIMMTDAQTNIIYVNAHFSAVSGYSADEAIGATPKILWSGETPKSVFADMRQTLEEGKVWRGEVCNRKKSGELYWENQSISPVRNHLGQTTHFIAVSEDITAQKLSSRRENSRNRILEAMAKGAPLAETLKLMIAMAEAELPESLCSIMRLDPTQGRLYSACGSALPAAYAEAIEGLQIGEKVGSCGTAAFTATRVVVEDIQSHPYWQGWREVASAAGLRACWSQPIMSSAGKVLGTLAIYYRSPRAPSADEIHVIELVASKAAICLEKDEAEQALRQQEDQARMLLAEHETILNNALVGIVYLKHRNVVSCNRRLEEIFGYDRGELTGESSEWFYESHQSFESIGKEAYRVGTEKWNYSTELVLKRKDGSLFHGALTGCAIDPQHPQEGSIWVYADISERHRAEQEVQKLLQAVEQSPVSIVITDREGLIEYVNPRFTKVTGYSSREALGQNPRILQSGETPPVTYVEMWQTLLVGNEWRGVIRNRRKNGELFWEEALISPILDETGRITHYIAVKEDITERKRIEDELAQHRLHLEELVEQRTADLSAALEAAKVADKTKDAFLANISHELRTPLNAVIGMAGLARSISTESKQRNYLDKIVSAGTHLNRIINDLLDLSKIAAGYMEIESIAFSLHGLLQRCNSVMAHRAADKGLQLVETIDAAVPDVLLGDPLRIEQILLNLVGNAIKFTQTGGIEVHVSLHARNADRVCLKIDVEDTGIGMRPEDLERLFKPFSQADATMSRRFGGTGLGLAISRHLAEMMEGDISVSSHEGAGTTFSVKIWLGLGDAAELQEVVPADRKKALPARYRKVQVLVVDDQPLNCEIVEALLTSVGITPRTAANGQAALDILRESGPHAFNLVLMDIQMPIMDGLTATREIRSWSGFAQLPIIAMTAHTMKHEKEISAAAGMNDHIGKPFETISFFQTLARWIPDIKHQMPADSVGLAALPSIDTQAGLARFMGNEKRYRHWLAEFVTEAPGYAAQIHQTLAAGNPDAARKSAHAIKGRVGMLGMTGLHPIAAELEAALVQGTPTADLLDQMQAAVKLLCAEIQAGLGAVAPAPAATPAPDQRPAGPMPESIVQLVGLLKCADGGSAEAIERCLQDPQHTDWMPRLQQALMQVRNFEFDTAVQVLAPDNPNSDKEN
jgi:PAS domain S-box-containing protein